MRWIVCILADITRPEPHLRHLLQFLGRPELADQQVRPILVSDCKRVTPEAVAACHRHNLYYLGPLPNGIVTTAVLHSVTVAELGAHPLTYRPQRVKPDAPEFVPYLTRIRRTWASKCVRWPSGSTPCVPAPF